MPFPIATAIAIYITIWWITLFAILPLGVRNAHEESEAPIAGTDPGAPVAPRLAMKALLTTAVSALIFAVLILVARAIG